MKRCWAPDPVFRPTFEEIIRALDVILSYFFIYFYFYILNILFLIIFIISAFLIYLLFLTVIYNLLFYYCR